MKQCVIRINGGRTKVRPYNGGEPTATVGTASCRAADNDAKAE